MNECLSNCKKIIKSITKTIYFKKYNLRKATVELTVFNVNSSESLFLVVKKKYWNLMNESYKVKR